MEILFEAAFVRRLARAEQTGEQRIDIGAKLNNSSADEGRQEVTQNGARSADGRPGPGQASGPEQDAEP